MLRLVDSVYTAAEVPKMLAELGAKFAFGVVLVTDEKSTEPIPGWSSEEQRITTTATAMVVKIRHEIDGPAAVRIWEGDPNLPDVIELDNIVLKSPSGALRVSTATGEHFVRIEVPPGPVRIRVAASAPRNPEEVHLVLAPSY